VAKRKKPEPAITEHWTSVLTASTQKVMRRRKAAEEAEAEREEHIRGAFSEGVLVGPIKEATGLSGSRCYQIKFALRDQDDQDMKDVAGQ
jgi:hypothetical protein